MERTTLVIATQHVMSLLTGRKTGRKIVYFIMFFFITAALVKVCLTTSRCDEWLDKIEIYIYWLSAKNLVIASNGCVCVFL